MAQTALPHFDHHLREVHRTRRRFKLGLAGLFVALFVVAGLQYRVSDAATLYTVSGKVYNATTGVGLPGVTLAVCAPGGGTTNVVTNASGAWQLNLPYQTATCVRYVSGAPSSAVGPVAVNNQPSHASAASYEHQVVGYNCYQNSSAPVCDQPAQSWDRGVDSGYTFKFANRLTAPVATPQPLSNLLSQPASADAPDKTAPTMPANFQATVSEGNAVVTLTWDPSTDAVGVTSYMLERSLDQVTWEKLADDIAATTYSDKDAEFGIHYYYRLSALDAAGNRSGYVLADVTTPDFQGTSTAEDGTNYSSEDDLVTVNVPAGAIAQSADCSVMSTPIYGDKPGGSNKRLVLGPYSILCKTAGGSQVFDFAKPLAWSFNVKDKLKDVQAPSAYTYEPSGTNNPVKGSRYDARSGLVVASTTTTLPVMVLAYVKTGVDLNVVAALILVIGIVVAVLALVLRKRQKSTYDDYLRKKYYNL